MSKTAIFEYKCRLCGERYQGAHTSVELAQHLLLSIVYGWNPPAGIIGMNPTLIATHPGCKLGYGVSDFLGYIVKKG